PSIDRATGPPAERPLSRQERRSAKAAGGGGKAAGDAARPGDEAPGTAPAISSRGQRMKAKTHSRMSGTIVPTPVSVSRMAPSPAQPGRPVFSTSGQAIQPAGAS